MRVCGGGYCSAINCSNNRKGNPHLSFFRFPKDRDRCKLWTRNCLRKDLVNKSCKYMYTNCVLCANHFEDSQFLNSTKKRLVWNATPTLFCVPEKYLAITSKRKLPQAELPLNRIKLSTTAEPSSSCAAKAEDNDDASWEPSVDTGASFETASFLPDQEVFKEETSASLLTSVKVEKKQEEEFSSLSLVKQDQEEQEGETLPPFTLVSIKVEHEEEDEEYLETVDMLKYELKEEFEDARREGEMTEEGDEAVEYKPFAAVDVSPFEEENIQPGTMLIRDPLESYLNRYN